MEAQKRRCRATAVGVVAAAVVERIRQKLAAFSEPQPMLTAAGIDVRPQQMARDAQVAFERQNMLGRDVAGLAGDPFGNLVPTDTGSFGELVVAPIAGVERELEAMTDHLSSPGVAATHEGASQVAATFGGLDADLEMTVTNARGGPVDRLQTGEYFAGEKLS